MDLGATEWATFRKVTLPLIAPGVAAAAMLAAAISFDDYVITSFNAGQTQTFPLFIFGATRQGVPAEVNVLATMLLIVVLAPDGPQPAGPARAAHRRDRGTRRLEPLTPRSRTTFGHPPEGRTEHAADRTGGRGRAGRDGGRGERGGRTIDDGPRPLRPDAHVDDGLQAARRRRDRGPHRGPARQPLRARARRRGRRARSSGCAATRAPWSATCRRRATPPAWPSGPTGGSTSRTPAGSWSCGPSAGDTAHAPTVYATGVPGSNGVAFDRRGDLWVTDGGTGPGPRVADRPRPRAGRRSFRVQPLANDVAPGRRRRATSAGCRPGRSRSPTTGAPGLQHARLPAPGGQRDRVRRATATLVRRRHRPRRDLARAPRPPRPRPEPRPAATRRSRPTRCAWTTILVQHPYLDGADGIVLDDDDNIYVAANERNAIAVVTDEGPRGRATSATRSVADRLRNAGPLEFPTSPVLVRPASCA